MYVYSKRYIPNNELVIYLNARKSCIFMFVMNMLMFMLTMCHPCLRARGDDGPPGSLGIILKENDISVCVFSEDWQHCINVFESDFPRHQLSPNWQDTALPPGVQSLHPPLYEVEFNAFIYNALRDARTQVCPDGRMHYEKDFATTKRWWEIRRTKEEDDGLQ